MKTRQPRHTGTAIAVAGEVESSSKTPASEMSATRRDSDGENHRCGVCGRQPTRPFRVVRGRGYRRCEGCKATLLDAKQWPTAEAEYARYLRHRNNPSDAGYRRFLSKLADPLIKRLPLRQEGLDYGCGPGPVLAEMLVEAGHRMRLFDPYFFPDRSVLTQSYDFITCTEAIEHFHRPAEEFARLERMLRPGGWLAVMTSFQDDDERFESWRYRLDPTHVVFYRESTLRFIARNLKLACEIPVKDVALMQKPLRYGTQRA